MFEEKIMCNHCKKTFYLNNFRLQQAKTVSCMYCNKRIIKRKDNASFNKKSNEK